MAKGKKGKRRVASPAPPKLKGVALLLTEIPVETLDLHGATARQAESRVLHFLTRHSGPSAGRVVHVITGKGNRSAGDPVLPGVVRDVLLGDGRDFVTDFAGLARGGGFAVRLRGSR